MIIRAVIAGVVSLCMCVLLMPIIIRTARSLKAKQPILHYVETHKVKSGTPTMGGIGFIIATCVVACIFFSYDMPYGYVSALVMLGSGIIGFLDDFLKVHFNKNEGLRPYQKIIFQLSIAVIVSLFAYYNEIGGVILLPFTLEEFDISWLSIPLYITIYIAFTNSTNLIDGLDGLASGTTTVYTFFFILLIIISCGGNYDYGQADIIILLACLAGSLLAFMCYNGYPAKVFMGDTGSLALGGLLGVTAIFTRMALSVIIIGFIFVMTSLSVIFQVAYYKLTKKRIFLMAPLHHHFEQKGVHENKIVIAYMVTTAVIGALYVSLCAIFCF